MSCGSHTFDDKDPQETDSFTFDWADRLTSGDTISGVAWTVPSGITQASSSNTTTTATIILSGGTAGQNYSITCTITTANSLILERTGIVPVRQL